MLPQRIALSGRLENEDILPFHGGAQHGRSTSDVCANSDTTVVNEQLHGLRVCSVLSLPMWTRHLLGSDSRRRVDESNFRGRMKERLKYLKSELKHVEWNEEIEREHFNIQLVRGPLASDDGRRRSGRSGAEGGRVDGGG